MDSFHIGRSEGCEVSGPVICLGGISANWCAIYRSQRFPVVSTSRIPAKFVKLCPGQIVVNVAEKWKRVEMQSQAVE